MKGYKLEGVKTAVRFLTIFSLGESRGASAAGLTREKAADALACFPLAGLVVGAVAAACVIALSPLADSNFARAIFAVAALAVITRGFHLDAVGDCFDALAYFGNPRKAFSVMKDKQLGAFGAAAVAFVIAAKIVALGAVSDEFFTSALVAVPAAARFGAAAVSFLSGDSAAASGGNLGAIFNFGGRVSITVRAAILALLIPLVLCGFGGIAIALAAGVFAFVLAMFFKSAFGNPNGDVHGTVIELCEVLGFVMAGAAL